MSMFCALIWQPRDCIRCGKNFHSSLSPEACSRSARRRIFNLTRIPRKYPMNVTLDRLLEFVSNHWLMASGFFIAIILLVQDIFDSAFRRHKMVSPGEAVTLMNNDSTVVLDIREPHEFSAGHISNALHIPLGKLDERAFELESSRNNPILVVCQVGTRSGAACKKLLKQGFPRLHELKGGMQAWQDEKLPVTKKR